MLKLPWLKILKFGLPVVLVAGLLYFVWTSGLNAGKASVEAAWNQEKLATARAVEELKGTIKTNEATYRESKQLLEDRLASAEVDHASSIAAIRAEHAGRLRQSADRASIYERLSDAGAAERSYLAGHAAELDRALEGGRLLVGELRSTLVQRDEQLRSLGQQLLDTRELMTSAGAPSE